MQDDTKTIGWLYLDEDGNEYVVLKPYVRRDIYVGFHMDRYNHFRPDTYIVHGDALGRDLKAYHR